MGRGGRGFGGFGGRSGGASKPAPPPPPAPAPGKSHLYSRVRLRGKHLENQTIFRTLSF